MANNAAGHRYLSNHNQVENNISDRGFISWCSSSRRTTQPTQTASSKPPSGSMTRWVKKSRKPNTFIPRSTDTSFQALNDNTEPIPKSQAPPAISAFARARDTLNRSVTYATAGSRSEEHTSELQSRGHLVCR